MLDVLQYLTDKYPSMTPAGKTITDQVFTNFEAVQSMPIAELAARCGVADATVTRYCRSLNFKSYDDFKQQLSKTIAVRMTKQEDLSFSQVYLYGSIKPEDSMQDLCRKVYTSSVSCLNQTMQRLDLAAVSRTVDMIERANHVYCCGQGSSFELARSLYTSFMGVCPKFQCMEDSHLQVIAISLCEPDDLVICVSFSGISQTTINALNTAKKRGAKTVLITYFAQSDSVDLADEVLLFGTRDGHGQYGSAGARCGMSMVIDMIYTEYCRRAANQTAANRETTASAFLSILADLR